MVEKHRNAQGLLRWSLLLLLVLAALPFGGVTPLATLTIRLASFALAAAAGWLALAEARPLPRKVGRLALAMAVPLAVGLLQLVPLPAPLAHVVAPRASALREQLATAVPETRTALIPTSVDALATRDALLTLVSCVAVGFVAAVAIRRRRHLRTALTVLACAGALQALYGAIEYLSGRQQLLGYVKNVQLESASGTFINRNHFAGYLALLLPAALFVAFEAAQRLRPARSWRERLLRLDDPAMGRLLLGVVATMTIWSGVLLSYSRGGLAAAAAGMVALVALASPRRWGSLALWLVLPVLLLLAEEIRAPGERLLAGTEELGSLHGRIPAWSGTLVLAREFLPLGSGLGTFASAFPLYQPAGVHGNWTHAHNDWLQAAAEGGPLCALAVVALAALAILPLARGRQQVGRVAVTAALVATGVACFVDFCLRIPAIAITAAALVGMSCRSAEADAAHDSAGRVSGSEPVSSVP